MCARVYLSYLQTVLQKSRNRMHPKRGDPSFKLVYLLVNKFDGEEGSDDGAAEQFSWLVVGVVVGGDEVIR